jgi:hypothetical protein
MAEREMIQQRELLTPEEAELLNGNGIERAARAVVSEAVARLVGALGLDSAASHEIIGAFRGLPLGAGGEVLGSAADVSEKVNQLTASISRRGAAVLEAVERANLLTLMDPILSTAEEAATAPTPEIVPIPAAESLAHVDTVAQEDISDLESEVEELHDDQERPIELNKRSLSYIQAIFGDVSSFNLREKHKSVIAHTIDELRGIGRPDSDVRLREIAPQLLLMFAGLKDKEIGAQDHIQKSGTAVSVTTSAGARRIKEQQDYSTEKVRAILAHNLGIADIQPEAPVEKVTEIEETVEEETVPEVEPAAEMAGLWLADTPVLGKLRGEVRRILRSNGHNHQVDLNAAYLGQLIDEMLVGDEVYKEAYLTYIQRGVRTVYDTDFARVIHSMPQKIASKLAKEAVVVHHRPTTHQNDSQSHRIASVSPLVMPRQRSSLAPVLTETAVKEEAISQDVEMHVLVRAAMEPETMSEHEWFIEARGVLAEACKTLGWSTEETSLLWNMVHFDKKHLYKRRTPATEEIRHKLFALMEEVDDERFEELRDIKASLTMLSNAAFGVKDLDDIQHSLKRKNSAITDGAAQRYVVAGIYELTRDV